MRTKKNILRTFVVGILLAISLAGLIEPPVCAGEGVDCDAAFQECMDFAFSFFPYSLPYAVFCTNGYLFCIKYLQIR